MQIFHEAFIPRRLEEVEDYEGDFQRIVNAGMDGDLEGIYYQTITGVCRLSLQPAMPSQCCWQPTILVMPVSIMHSPELSVMLQV